MRLAAWGQQGISFWVRSQGRPRRVAVVLFPAGKAGPYTGTPGSPIRRQLVGYLTAWTQNGEVPEEARFS